MKHTVLFLTVVLGLSLCAVAHFARAKAVPADPPQGRQFELGCPVGYSPMPGWVTVDPSNGKARAVACVNVYTGRVFLQPDTVGGAIASLPVSLTSGVSGVLPKANGGTGTATPGLTAGSGINLSGTWPNQTIASTASGGVSEATLGQCGPNFYVTTAGIFGCKYYLTKAHTLLRIYVAMDGSSGVLLGCTTQPVISLYDVTAGAALASVTIPNNATAKDSSTLSVPMPANHVYVWTVSTVAAGCSTFGNGFASATYE